MQKTKRPLTSIVSRMLHKKGLNRGSSKSNVLRYSEISTIFEITQRNITNFFFKNSYIATNVSMMTWSIIYHSWFGFVLLIWSNVIWISSNRRKMMMKSSSFLVFYAILLLIVTYIFGMKFTEQELPSFVNHINLVQIGLVRNEKYPGIHIIAKSFLTLSFWITMRVENDEKNMSRHKKPLTFKEAVLMLIKSERFVECFNELNDYWSVIQVIGPDSIVTSSTIILISLTKKFTSFRKEENERLRKIFVLSKNYEKSFEASENGYLNYQKFRKVITIVSIISIGLAGAVEPSILNSIYFVSFLIIATWLGVNRDYQKKFAVFLKILSFLLIVHITAILLYQNKWFEHEINDQNWYERLLGLDLYYISDNSNKLFQLTLNNELQIDDFLNPFVLIGCYLIISTASQFILMQKTKRPLTSIVSRMLHKKGLNRGSSKSNVLRYSEISTIFEITQRNITNFFFKNSYIATNVSMMTWSIIYHSWFGFVLLIWSNVIWISSNRRKMMMKSSSFLVFYAILLLIVTYIFGMKFTEQELPSFVNHINLVQIGLVRNEKYPGIHIIAKSFLTLSFWITMRVENDEKNMSRHKKPLTFKEAVLMLIKSERERKKKSWKKKLIRVVEKFCVHWWMWIIIVALFIMSVTGKEMSLFRIINMTFVLSFILIFQISFKLWMKIMNFFWTTLISYAMTALILIYIFQFDDFPSYQWLKMIGIKKYLIGKLFVKLLPFTLIIVLTGLQKNSFHNKYLKIHEGNILAEDFEQLRKYSSKAIEKLLLMLEIHLFKILFISLFWLAAKNNNFVDLCIIMTLTFGSMTNKTTIKIFLSIIISIASMILIIFRMINFLVDSNLMTETLSNACHLTNVTKALQEGSNNSPVLQEELIHSTFPFIVYVILITISVSLERGQKRKRRVNRLPDSTPKIVFEDISRQHADESFENLLKFLVNYGFYKLGIEITLLMFMILILTHADLVALLYITLWILILFRDRTRIEWLWKVLTVVIAVSIIAQTMMLISVILERNCLVTYFFNKNNEMMELEKVVINFFTSIVKHPEKLIFDYLLFMCMLCQLEVFNQEKSRQALGIFEGGGSNIPFTKMNFTSDEHLFYEFKGKHNNPMKFFKQYIFRIHFWITLLIIFVVGSQSKDVFSLGYIFGVFIFLWIGTNFFLKPLKSINCWWNGFIMYSLIVIVIKVSLRALFCSEVLNVSSMLVSWPISCEIAIHHYSYFYDGITLMAMIIQRKIFRSFYFYNTIYDAFASSILASRGLELLEELRISEVRQQINEEHENLKSLRFKMENIKKSTCSMGNQRIIMDCHDAVIHSGGSYMFDDNKFNSKEMVEVDSIYIDQTSEVKITDQTSKKKMKNSKKKMNNKIQEYILRMLMKIVIQMHNLSRKQIIIIEILSEDKKILKSTIEKSELMDKTLSNYNFNNFMGCQNQAIIHHLLKKLKRITSINLDQYKPPNSLQICDFLKAIFYFLLSLTDILVYSLLIIVQIKSSCVFLLPLTLLVFLWAFLQFPQPSKTFWVIMIAYTQCFIFLRLLSKFNFLSWIPTKSSINFLGLQQFHEFAVSDLCLLVALFMQRSVLKKFGLWKSSMKFQLEEGFFEIIECDVNTANLIEFCSANNIAFKTNGHDYQEVSTNSSELLINDENILDRKILMRHELKVLDETLNKKTIKVIYKNQNEIMKAYEIISMDRNNQILIKLFQDDIQLSLRMLEISEYSQNIFSSNQLVEIESLIEEPFDFFPTSSIMSLKHHLQLKSHVMNDAKEKALRKRVDVYKYMFLCDFINFFILVFGFHDFDFHPSTKRKPSVLNFIQENKIPTTLLTLLILQFLMITIDRALYIRKKMKAKLIFHVFIVIYTHIWLFIMLPLFKDQTMNEKIWPILFYIIKCIYLLLSAYQIRCGYPARTSGNFLMSSYGSIRLISFKIYMLIPFLFELRTVIDWMFTATSLTFSEWLRVESIHAEVFRIKCARVTNKGMPRAKKRPWWDKLILGGVISILLITVLWFPLALFAYQDELGQPNIPKDFSLSFFIGNFEIYKSQANSADVRQMTEKEWRNFRLGFEKNNDAKTLLNEFNAVDIAVVLFSKHSSSIWNISPPRQAELIKIIKENKLNTFRFTYQISQQNLLTRRSDVIRDSTEVDFSGIDLKEKLIEMIKNGSETSIEIGNVFPKYLRVLRMGKILFLKELIDLKSILLKLHNVDNSKWWEVSGKLGEKCLKPHDVCNDFLEVIYFNQKSLVSKLEPLNNYLVKGIISFYVSLIVIFCRFFRATIFNMSTVTIIVEELPNVDKIINLCNDIYFVREAKEFSLEEDLVAKLLFLYRSPETLRKWTESCK
ncbi:CLUMA_CG013369, isoform A [Clunio marinus]|uniref:CLUMA_CG013369, isoform A n=1 Tax=Clunio marinus TaxID=568069 RepID=A0A1J1IIL9_9DIPT|nr:CLUMA_CG013369, isoform A [Clunio marinus]